MVARSFPIPKCDFFSVIITTSFGFLLQAIIPMTNNGIIITPTIHK